MESSSNCSQGPVSCPPADTCAVFLASAHHEGTLFYGCFEPCDCQVQLLWDGDQVIYADFKSGQSVWTAPLLSEVEQPMSEGFYILAQDSKQSLCNYYLSRAVQEDKSPSEDKGKGQ